MIKTILFAVLKSAIGFFTVALVFLALSHLGNLPAQTYEVPGNPYFTYLFQGTALFWLAGTAIGLIALFDRTTKMGRILSYAPIWVPILYTLIAYIALSLKK